MIVLSHFVPISQMPAAGINSWRRFATVTVTETKGWWRWKRTTRYTAGIWQTPTPNSPWRFMGSDEPCPAGQVEDLIQKFLDRDRKPSFFGNLGI